MLWDFLVCQEDTGGNRRLLLESKGGCIGCLLLEGQAE